LLLLLLLLWRHSPGRWIEKVWRWPIAHVGRWWRAPMLLLLLLLLLVATAIVVVTTATTIVSTAAIVVVIVVVVVVVVAIIVVIVVVIVVVVHSHSTSPIHGPSSTRRWRNESGPDPAPFTRFFVVIKRNPRALVGILLPIGRQGRNHGIILAPCSDKALLGGGQSHSGFLPFDNVLLVVEFKVFTKLPTPALLFAARGAVVRQIRIGIIVKETGHCELNV